MASDITRLLKWFSLPRILIANAFRQAIRFLFTQFPFKILSKYHSKVVIT